MAHIMHDQTRAGEDPRKLKRFFRRNGLFDPVYEALMLGDEHAYNGKPKRNPYPPGRRHDEYERGYLTADDQKWMDSIRDGAECDAR